MASIIANRIAKYRKNWDVLRKPRALFNDKQNDEKSNNVRKFKIIFV
jgi:hypothetical protein